MSRNNERQAFGHALGLGRSHARSPYLWHRPQLVGGVAPKPPFIFECSLIPELSFMQSHHRTQFYAVSSQNSVLCSLITELSFMQSHHRTQFYSVLSPYPFLSSLIPYLSLHNLIWTFIFTVLYPNIHCYAVLFQHPSLHRVT